VIFETSTNTTNWTGLGTASHIPGGWELPAGSPEHSHPTIRARGFVAGAFNGSSWSVESSIRVNLRPLADASATPRLVISENGTNATVVLNGSLSADPENDPLQYGWLEIGSPHLFGSNVISPVTLSLGGHAIRLVVSDGELSATNDVVVEIISEGEALERLLAVVNEHVPRPQLLAATLRAAAAAIERNNFIAAINQLQAFQNQVRAQVAPYDPVLAARLIDSARTIVTALNGHANPHGEQHARFSSIQRQNNGHMHLKFSAEPGRTHIIEASIDLEHWEPIGVARELNDSFGFEDTEAARFTTRFYRITSP
jgi:hypothetical protein